MAKKIVKLEALAQLPRPVDISEDEQIMVRPLTLKEMVGLFIDSREAFLPLYAAGISLDVDSLAPFLLSAPQLVARIIALASDEPEKSVLIETLMPAPVQLIALSEIWKASVPDPKKAQELLSEVMALLQKANERYEKEATKKGLATTSPPESSFLSPTGTT